MAYTRGNRRSTGQSKRSSRKDWRQNEFLLTVFQIAQDEGYDPRHILPLFEPFMSFQFICGPPAQWNRHQIPERVWQRVCDHYFASAQAPYRRLDTAIQPTMFKETSMVFIGGKVTSRLIRSQLIAERFSTTKRLYQYLNWTMRCDVIVYGADLTMFDRDRP